MERISSCISEEIKDGVVDIGISANDISDNRSLGAVVSTYYFLSSTSK